MTLFQGDDTAAFGGNFLSIYLTVKDEEGNIIEPQPKIIKAEIKIGCIRKIFENPDFPILEINLTNQETATLKAVNNIYMAVWDENGLKRTCEGMISFEAQTRRV